tara:strand:- start:165 stop:371 length:207 start_codon:yes stop_codon:yes gene_type:complete
LAIAKCLPQGTGSTGGCSVWLEFVEYSIWWLHAKALSGIVVNGLVPPEPQRLFNFHDRKVGVIRKVGL